MQRMGRKQNRFASDHTARMGSNVNDQKTCRSAIGAAISPATMIAQPHLRHAMRRATIAAAVTAGDHESRRPRPHRTARADPCHNQHDRASTASDSPGVGLSDHNSNQAQQQQHARQRQMRKRVQDQERITLPAKSDRAARCPANSAVPVKQQQPAQPAAKDHQQKSHPPHRRADTRTSR